MGIRNSNSKSNDRLDFSHFLERARKLEQLICERGCLEEKLSNLIRSLTPLKDLHKTLEEIIRHVVEIYGASVVRLWLLETGGEKIHLGAQAGEVLPGNVTELTSNGIVGEIVRTRTFLYSPEVLKSPYLQDKDWVIKNQLITHLGFPLIAEGELLGVLTTAYKCFRPFSQEEIKWFSFIADVAAIAIKNALLHEEIKVTGNIAKSILSDLSIKDTYLGITTELKKVMDFDRMSIALLVKEEDLILTYVQSGVEEGTMLREGRTYPLKGSVVERVLATGKPVIIEDTRKGELETDRLLLKDGLMSRLCYPLRVKGRFIGSLNFSSKIPGYYSTRHLQLLEHVASQLAMAIQNTLLFEKLREESIVDPLTGAYNRRYLLERLEEEVLRSKRTGLPFALLLCDVNRFKLANDLYGHSLGDKILKTVSSVLKDALRRTDVLCRYGGDEFVIVLPETDLEGALILASKINKTLPERTPEDIKALDFPLELSIGITVCPFEGDSPDELISKADHACYRAKLEPGHIYPPAKDYSEVKPIDLPSIFFNTLATAIDMKDRHTHGHSYVVTQLAVMLAHKLGLSSQQIKDIRIAAMMHDVGKIAIPDSILGKPDKLTQEEWVVMKGHVEAGLEILKKIPGTERILPIMEAIHENYDGSGYPKGLSRHDIPIEARIIAVADTYQALISKRSYRGAKSHDEALEIIRASYGKQFDPKVASIFVEMMSKRTIK